MLNQLFYNRFFELLKDTTTHLSMQHCFHVFFHIMGHNTCMLGILEKISPSELVSNSYISNHNKVRRPRPKFKISFFLYFCCLWINVTQIKFDNIKRKLQRIISDSCFHLKSRFNFDARAPSIPLLNFPFNVSVYHWSNCRRSKCHIFAFVCPPSWRPAGTLYRNSSSILLSPYFP